MGLVAILPGKGGFVLILTISLSGSYQVNKTFFRGREPGWQMAFGMEIIAVRNHSSTALKPPLPGHPELDAGSNVAGIDGFYCHL
jgi:hypothetical protein